MEWQHSFVIKTKLLRLQMEHTNPVQVRADHLCLQVVAKLGSITTFSARSITGWALLRAGCRNQWKATSEY